MKNCPVFCLLFNVQKLKALCKLVCKSPTAKNLHNVFKRIFIVVLSLSDYSGMICIQIYFFYFFQDSWFGVLHHVCGDHEWADGSCNHGPLVDIEEGKTILQKGSKAMEAIRKVIIDPRFLSTLQYYVTFR
mgnify:CR=1 FL=1